MGQHKYNPNCQLAKERKLPPKPKKMSKREAERLMYAKCQEILYRPLIKAYENMQETDYFKG
jgi:hypothetical protein